MKRFLGLILTVALLLSVAFVPARASDNIAFGKNPIAGEWSGTFVPERALDGNYDTIWAEGATVDLGTKGGYSNWVGVDLGAQYSIERIVVATRRDVDQSDSRKGWLAQVTNDPKLEDWVTVDKKTSSGSFQSLWEVPCALDTGYRYVRIASAAHIALAELEVYGELYDPDAFGRMKYTDIEELSCKNEMKLLHYLGLSQKLEKSSSEFGPYQALTRGRAADIIVAMLNASMGDVKGSSYFADVPPDHPMNQAIGTCVRMGVISAGGSFRPDDYIKPAEFMKMIVYALGYGPKAEAGGGYPIGVLSVASRLRLNMGIPESEDDMMNHGDAAGILINALTSSRIEAENNILEKNFGLTLHKGVVTANGITSLSAGADMRADSVEIDGVRYTDKSGGIGDFLSKQIWFCTNEHQEIVCFWEADNEVLRIECNDITSSDANGVDYIKEDKRDRALFRRGVSILKNGVASQDVRLTDLKQLQGFIELVDNNQDGEYDALFLYETTLVIVEQIAFEDETLKIASQNGDSVIADKVKRLTVFLDGAASKISKLSKGCSLYLSVSDNGECVRIDASSKQAGGVVTEYSDDEIVIGGQTILLSDYYKKNVDKMDPFSLGSEVTVSLDKEGTVVWLFCEGSITSRENIGYVSAVQIGDDLDKTLELKIFTEGGEFKVYEVRDSVSIDGIRYKNGAAGELGINYFKGKFMLYTLSDNVITAIDTENDSGQEENSKMKVTEVPLAHNMLYMTDSNGIYLRHQLQTPLKNNTKMFFIPTQGGQVPDREFDSNYKVSTAEAVLGNNQQLYDNLQLKTVKCFGSDEFGFPQFAATFKEFSVASGDSRKPVSSNAPAMIIEKIALASADGEVAYEAQGYSIADGKAVSVVISPGLTEFYEGNLIQQEKFDWLAGEGNGYYIDSARVDPEQVAGYVNNVKTLKSGDVIRYSVQNNMAIELERIYDSDFGNTAWSSSTGMFYSTGSMCGYSNAQFRLVYGTPERIADGYLRLRISGGGYDVLAYSGAKVFIFDGRRLRKGNGNDLLMYSGNAAANVLAHQESGKVKSIVIYE